MNRNDVCRAASIARRGICAAALAFTLLSACTRRPAAPAAPVRYTVGPGYQLAGTWFYPREDFHYDATGISAVLPDASGLTADNEPRDPTALAAAHQTLQLPSIARVTNLENGSSLLVRINDRGPASPARIIALSPRAATLLGIASTARVRVQVEEAPSAALREQLQGGPVLRIAAAPRTAVTTETLAPPPGIGQSARGRNAPTAAAAAATQTAPAGPPDHLPETVTRGPPQPGTLVIWAGSFAQPGYARQRAATLAALGARTETRREGRTARYDVRLGPYPTIPAADSALDQVRRTGVSDARIEVE